MAVALYRGFSTTGVEGLNTTLYDIELVKQDLLNHFNTRLGERVGRPEFGSIIPELLFDLVDDRTESLVVQDAERIINEDPRVTLLELEADVNPDNHTIQLDIKLRALEFDMNTQFSIIFQESF